MTRRSLLLMAMLTVATAVALVWLPAVVGSASAVALAFVWCWILDWPPAGHSLPNSGTDSEVLVVPVTTAIARAHHLGQFTGVKIYFVHSTNRYPRPTTVCI